MDNLFPIFIKGNNLKIVYINSNSLVSDLKKKINLFSEKYHYLAYIGKVLNNNKLKIIDYGVKKNCTIELHVRGL